MKKLIIISILTYLSFTINSSGLTQNQEELESSDILKIGVLLPLSGEFQDVGQSFLKSIQLALYDVSNKDVKIYPKDSKGNALSAYQSAKEFEENGIKIVIGPIFYESLERLNEISEITFISFTNKTNNIPKNVISFGVNIESQIDVLNEYFNKEKIIKTLLLSPKNKFENEVKIIKNSKINFNKTFVYDISPKKITGEIEKLTKYRERKKDLERRIKILEKSDLYKDQNELKKLEQMHTLGNVNFDSVIVVDFGERLKSVLTSFMFSDISSKKVNFFTVNQWFDKSFFNENALQNLHFPGINLNNLEKFNKKFQKKFKTKPYDVSILAYDALGLIYYCWSRNNYKFKKEQLYNDKGFKGLHSKFYIENNISKQKLKIYKVSEKKFIKIY
jgi:hypothetical protein